MGRKVFPFWKSSEVDFPDRSLEIADLPSIGAAKILVGAVTTGYPTAVDMSGDATIANDGTVTVTSVNVTGAVENPIVLGTSVAPLTSATADNKFVEIRATTTATSGDMRGIYTALTMNGAGIQGEAIRGRTIVTAAVTGSHGGHFGLEYGAGGSISGLGVGCRATLMCPDSTISGTVCGGMSELWAEGASSDFSGATHAIHRFVMDGNATGIDTAVNVFDFAGLGTTTQFVAATNATIDHALQVRVNGVTYWIGLYDATTGS